MLCENCDKNPATVHLTEIVEDIKKEVHLCEDCASEKGLSFKKQFSLQDLIGTLVSQGAQEGEIEDMDISCPSCGITFSDFQSKGRLGCPEDYVVFKGALDQLLEKIHGATQHFGKVPSSAGESLAVEKELMELKQKLAESVKKERYEEAAELRDRITSLEKSQDQVDDH